MERGARLPAFLCTACTWRIVALAKQAVSGGLAGSQLADPREACREAVGIISLCPSPVPFSRGSPSTLIWRLIRQKWEQLAGQRQDRKMGSGLFAAHTTEQRAGGCASISALP